MGQPAGRQAPYTERPLKVYGEQYVEGQPLPVGAVIDPIVAGMPLYSDGQPRVPLSTGWVVVNVTDWVVSDPYSGEPIAVMTTIEFEARYGETRADAEVSPA
jgi:hypothetical protein